jgi:uncharacterized protein (TIGR03000 family)
VGCLLAGISLAQAQEGKTGTIVIQVPANAEVTIGGQATTQTGSRRTFNTKELAPGFTYLYEFKATWEAGGKKQTASRWIEVHPGQRVVVNLAAPEPIPGPKKVETRKEEPKKEEHKKEEPKKEEHKKADDKQDDLKKDEPKKEPSARTSGSRCRKIRRIRKSTW